MMKMNSLMDPAVIEANTIVMSGLIARQTEIARLIDWSIHNRLMVLLLTAVLIAAGLWSIPRLRLDAIPDLSDVQVIIRTPYPGQAPQIVENQVTYPIASTMLSVPGARVVRGYSFTGDSFVYVLFDDQTERFTQMCGARIPQELHRRLRIVANDPAAVVATGVQWAVDQGRALLHAGAPGLHFYTLNRSSASLAVHAALGL